MLGHTLIVIICRLLVWEYTIQYNSSQSYFLQATTWKRPFKKSYQFSLDNLRIIQSKLKLTSENHVRTGRTRSCVVWKQPSPKKHRKPKRTARSEEKSNQKTKEKTIGQSEVFETFWFLGFKTRAQSGQSRAQALTSERDKSEVK